MGNGVIPVGAIPIGILRIVPELAIVDLQGILSTWPLLGSNWQSVGPSIWYESESQPQRYQSGQMSQVCIDPNDSNCIYASGIDGGLWRLNSVFDYPNNLWIPLTDQNPTLRTSAFAIAPTPTDSRILYLGDGNGNVLRSDDAGDHWRLTSNTQFGYISKILVHPSNANKIYVAADLNYRVWTHGGESGFFESKNGGSTWERLHIGEVTDAVMDPDSPSIMYVGIRDQGLYRVTNEEERWDWNLVYPSSNVTFPPGEQIQLSTIKIALGRQGDPTSRLVAVKFHKQLFTNTRAGLGEWHGAGDVGQWGDLDQSESCNVIAIDPFNNNVILSGLQDLYRTLDGGANGNQSWVKVAGYNMSVHSDQMNIVFDPSNIKIVYLANDGGVYRSTDNGENWSELNRGLVTSQMAEGIAISNSSVVVSVFHAGLVTTDNVFSRTPVWKGIPGGESQYNKGIAWEWTKTYADPKRTNVFYVFGTRLVRRILGSGISTTNIVPIGNFRPQAIAVDSRPDHDIILSSCREPDPNIPHELVPKIKRTLEGNSDTPVWNDEIVDQIRRDESIISMAFAPSNLAMAYAVSDLGNVYRKTDVESSSSWQRMGQWNEPSVKQLVVNPELSRRIYLLSNSKLAFSENAGGSFRLIHGSGRNSLPSNGELTSLVAYPFNPQVLFVGSSVGIFVTTNDGASWFRFDHGLPNAVVTQILWHRSSLFASTMGRGLWQRVITHRSTFAEPDDTLYYLVERGKKHDDPVINKELKI